MTLKNFIQKSHINDKLIRAVVRQMGGYYYFTEYAQEITNHGINGGFPGFIYYVDTVAFAKRNLKTILEMAEEIATDLGETDGYQLIAGFTSLRKSHDLTGGRVANIISKPEHKAYTDVMNALAGFAAEEVARSYDDITQRGD